MCLLVCGLEEMFWIALVVQVLFECCDLVEDFVCCLFGLTFDGNQGGDKSIESWDLNVVDVERAKFARGGEEGGGFVFVFLVLVLVHWVSFVFLVVLMMIFVVFGGSMDVVSPLIDVRMNVCR